MFTLDTLKNCCRPKKAPKRVGRGLGSGLGKTCGRGEKGAGSRSGYKRRWGYEGGQFRLFMKLPIRGFSNAPFRVSYEAVNLGQVEKMYQDGETVNSKTLAEKGFIKGKGKRVKLLGNGELTKRVKVEIAAMSESARQKLEAAKIEYCKK